VAGGRSNWDVRRIDTEAATRRPRWLITGHPRWIGRSAAVAALALTLFVPGSAFAAAATAAPQVQAATDKSNKPAAENKSAVATAPASKTEPKSQPVPQTSAASMQPKADSGAAKNEIKGTTNKSESAAANKSEAKRDAKGETKRGDATPPGGQATPHAKNDPVAVSTVAADEDTGKGNVEGKGVQTRYPPTLERPFEQSGADEGDNRHPSGKDRSVENGPEGADGSIQGKSPSAPDNDGRGPERDSTLHPGVDKPGYSGGDDRADQDNNNGCGNDDDFEDDNEGWCGGHTKRHMPEEVEHPDQQAPEPQQPVEQPPDNRVDVCRGGTFMAGVKDSDVRSGDRIVGSAVECKRAETAKTSVTPGPAPVAAGTPAPAVEVAKPQPEAEEQDVPALDEAIQQADAPVLPELAALPPVMVADLVEVAGATVAVPPVIEPTESVQVFAFVPLEEAVPLNALDLPLEVARAPMPAAQNPSLSLLPSTGGPAPTQVALALVGLGAAGLGLRRIGRR
jgi:hypothetical protein